MLTLTSNPLHRDFAVRPVCKETDRPLIRDIFRKEFYGTAMQTYPDEGLWEIYDSMGFDDNEVFGAYLVSYLDHPLFLLEIHPPVQMDLSSEYISEPGTVGIYCFYISGADPMNLPGFHACISSLLDQPGVDQIVTTTNQLASADPAIAILRKCGFSRLPQKTQKTQSPGRSFVYRCTQISFPLLADLTERRTKVLAH